MRSQALGLGRSLNCARTYTVVVFISRILALCVAPEYRRMLAPGTRRPKTGSACWNRCQAAKGINLPERERSKNQNSNPHFDDGPNIFPSRVTPASLQQRCWSPGLSRCDASDGTRAISDDMKWVLITLMFFPSSSWFASSHRAIGIKDLVKTDRYINNFL